MEKIVQAAAGITLLGAGPTKKPQFLQALALAPVLVAADGGVKTALKFAQIPTAVIGDMDSLPPDVNGVLPPEIFHRISQQDTTDFDKCLARIVAPFAIATGVTGARVDHTLGVLNSLSRFQEFPVLVLSDCDVIFACPAVLRLRLPVGTRFSLFPMAAATARSRGLKWPLDGIGFAPSGRTAISNQTSAEQVEITPDGRGMLCILPRRFLKTALGALCGDI